jgi:hypothetical protein
MSPRSQPRPIERPCELTNSFCSAAAGLGCPGTQAVQARKVPACKMPGTVRYHTHVSRYLLTDAMSCLSREQGVNRPYALKGGREWGPKVPCCQGGMGTGQQDLVAAVTQLCWRALVTASFGAQLDEEDSWNGMITIMRHPLSSRSGAPRPLNGRRPCLSLPPIIQERQEP